MVLLDRELQIPHSVRDDNPFQVASGIICRSGQALEAVPFPFVEGKHFSRA